MLLEKHPKIFMFYYRTALREAPSTLGRLSFRGLHRGALRAIFVLTLYAGWTIEDCFALLPPPLSIFSFLH